MKLDSRRSQRYLLDRHTVRLPATLDAFSLNISIVLPNIGVNLGSGPDPLIDIAGTGDLADQDSTHRYTGGQSSGRSTTTLVGFF